MSNTDLAIMFYGFILTMVLFVIGYICSIKIVEDIRKCKRCANQHTWECPSSKQCWDTNDKPYFKAKESE